MSSPSSSQNHCCSIDDGCCAHCLGSSEDQSPIEYYVYDDVEDVQYVEIIDSYCSSECSDALCAECRKYLEEPGSSVYADSGATFDLAKASDVYILEDTPGEKLFDKIDHFNLKCLNKSVTRRSGDSCDKCHTPKKSKEQEKSLLQIIDSEDSYSKILTDQLMNIQTFNKNKNNRNQMNRTDERLTDEEEKIFEILDALEKYEQKKRKRKDIVKCSVDQSIETNCCNCQENLSRSKSQNRKQLKVPYKSCSCQTSNLFPEGSPRRRKPEVQCKSCQTSCRRAPVRSVAVNRQSELVLNSDLSSRRPSMANHSERRGNHDSKNTTKTILKENHTNQNYYESGNKSTKQRAPSHKSSKICTAQIDPRRKRFKSIKGRGNTKSLYQGREENTVRRKVSSRSGFDISFYEKKFSENFKELEGRKMERKKTTAKTRNKKSRFGQDCNTCNRDRDRLGMERTETVANAKVIARLADMVQKLVIDQ